MRVYLSVSSVLAVLALALACASPASPGATSTTSTSTSTGTSGGSGSTGSLPAVYARFQSAVTVSISGSTVTLVSNTTPDHKSPYWGVGHALYEAPHEGMQVNPNRIIAQTLTLRVPASPTLASSASDTPMGPIGMAVNGVPLFNQYAAGRSPLGAEIVSFDRYDGHPQQTGQYHYHLEPYWLTDKNGAAGLIGVLLDGFPVYGTKETTGAAPSGLDTCNGHTHATTEFPSGIYHYHVTATTPYISGCYKGNAGSVG